MNSSASSYLAYGLRIQSSIALPCRSAPPGPAPDVTVRIGDVRDSLPAPAAGCGPWQAAPGVFRLDVDGVARYLVRAGREIVIEASGGSESDVRTFLLGSVFGALLQQRGILTLHASAIETDKGAVCFAGRSGAGKSTLLAALLDRGFAMLADDVTGVLLDAKGRPVALRAFPEVRLWPDAVDALGWQDRTRRAARSGLDKQVASVDGFRSTPLAVRAVATLAPHNRDAIEIETLPRAANFEALVQHTYRRRFLRPMERQREHFQVVTALARHAPVLRVRRPMHPFHPAALAEAVERHLQAEL